MEEESRYFVLGNSFHMHKGDGKIFNDPTYHVIEMLEGYGLTHFDKEKVNSDIDFTDPEKDGNLIIVEYSRFCKPKGYKLCEGSNCHKFPRIGLQTEQLNSHGFKDVIEHVINCHESPSSAPCVIWDFSDFHVNLVKSWNKNVSDSFLIIPYMHHDRFREHYPKDPATELVSYNERTIDATFFGYPHGRRKRFSRTYMTTTDEKKNKTTTGILSPYNVMWRHQGLDRGEETNNPKIYSDSKNCFCVHGRGDLGAGEYHRVSDFRRFGCRPIMESFADVVPIRALETCAGIQFPDFDHLASAIVNELNRMNRTDPTILRAEHK
jgi:hypothetical protein